MFFYLFSFLLAREAATSFPIQSWATRWLLCDFSNFYFFNYFISVILLYVYVAANSFPFQSGATRWLLCDKPQRIYFLLHTHTHIYIHKYVYIHIYIYTLACLLCQLYRWPSNSLSHSLTHSHYWKTLPESIPRDFLYHVYCNLKAIFTHFINSNSTTFLN